jgi:subtilisin family serine protease
VLGVGALGSSSKKVWGSSGRGVDVDLVAPGQGSGVIVSSELPDIATAQTGSTPNGTSYATPIVSGAAALVWARHPAWDASRVEAALLMSARHLSGARPNTTSGFGRLDVKAALKAAPAADLDEPNEWPAAARLAVPLAHATRLAATVGGNDDPLDAYPLTTKGSSTVRVQSARPMQAFLLRAASVDAIDRSVATVGNAASARATGTRIQLHVPRKGSWFLVVVARHATAPVGYTIRVG